VPQHPLRKLPPRMPSAAPPSLRASSVLPCGARPPRMSRSRIVRTQPHVAPPHRHRTQPHPLLSSYLYYFLRAERRRPHRYSARFCLSPPTSSALLRSRMVVVLSSPPSTVSFPRPRPPPQSTPLPSQSLSNPGAHLSSTKRLFLAPRYAHPDHDKWALNVSVPLHFLELASQQTPLCLGLPPPDPAAMVTPPLPHPCHYENIQVVGRTVPRATCPFSSVTARLPHVDSAAQHRRAGCYFVLGQGEPPSP
jgi:hypothetical protein